jgi:hypothetical protein
VAASGARPSRSYELDGVFKLRAGRCGVSGAVSGSYFRLIFPGGNAKSGKFFVNAYSRCSDKTYTLLSPGVQGGLRTDAYQPDPTPAFTRKGNAAAKSIVAPVSFTGVNLSLATNATDRQTRHAVPKPRVIENGGLLLGQVEAVSASWDKIYFNQGSPKPGGRTPGLTSGPIGHYNARTHAFALTWLSQIVGGRFSGLTGYWHLTGTFKGSVNPLPATRRGSSGGVPRADVHLINCGAAPGGWSAGGTVRNPTSQPATYHITVYFIATSSGRRLASSSAEVTLGAGRSNLWSTKASFNASAAVGCVLGGVSTG